MAGDKQRVWLKERKNPKKKSGAPATISYTLQWRDEKTGKDRFESLGTLATKEDAEMKRAEKEIQLNLRKPDVQLAAAAPGQLSVRLQDIYGVAGRKEEFNLQIQVKLPELGFAETLPMQVPIEITPFLYMAHSHPTQEAFGQHLVLDVLEQVATFLVKADFAGVRNADDNERWASELSAWRRRLIQYLYAAEFGGDGCHATNPPPTEVADTPVARPVVKTGPLPSSCLSVNAFSIRDEAEPDDPRLKDRLHRGQISLSAEEDEEGENESERPFEE